MEDIDVWMEKEFGQHCEEKIVSVENKCGHANTDEVEVGFVNSRGRRIRPPKRSPTRSIPHPTRSTARPTKTPQQQRQQKKDKLLQLVHQCDDQMLKDIVLPRLAKSTSLWQLLLAKVAPDRHVGNCFPDIYREFESLHDKVTQAAEEYVVNPLVKPLEIRNVEVARSVGILHAWNVVRAPSPTSRQKKNVHFMENPETVPPKKRFKKETIVPVHHDIIKAPNKDVSQNPETLPPKKRFKKEAIVPVHHDIIKAPNKDEKPVTPVTSTAMPTVFSSLVVSPPPSSVMSTVMPSITKPLVVIPSPSSVKSTTAATSSRTSSSPSSTPAKSPSTQAPPASIKVEVTKEVLLQNSRHQILSPCDKAAETKELESSWIEFLMNAH